MFRKLENVREKILEATLQIGAEKGFNAISARTVASACDISTHTIYENFKSMQELIDEVAQTIRHGHLQFLKDLIMQGNDSTFIYNSCLDRFIENKNDTLFYISYLHSIKDPISCTYSEETLRAAKALFTKDLSDEMLYLIWDYVRVTSFYYAKSIIKGYIPNDEKNRENIKKIILNGLEYFRA